jgi:hypothetical protein
VKNLVLYTKINFLKISTYSYTYRGHPVSLRQRNVEHHQQSMHDERGRQKTHTEFWCENCYIHLYDFKQTERSYGLFQKSLDQEDNRNTVLLRNAIQFKTSLNLLKRVSVSFPFAVYFNNATLNSTVVGTWLCFAVRRFLYNPLKELDRTAWAHLIITFLLLLIRELCLIYF